MPLPCSVKKDYWKNTISSLSALKVYIALPQDIPFPKGRIAPFYLIFSTLTLLITLTPQLHSKAKTPLNSSPLIIGLVRAKLSSSNVA